MPQQFAHVYADFSVGVFTLHHHVGSVLLYRWNTWGFGLFSNWRLIYLCVGCIQQPPLFIIAISFLLYGTR